MIDMDNIMLRSSRNSLQNNWQQMPLCFSVEWKRLEWTLINRSLMLFYRMDGGKKVNVLIFVGFCKFCGAPPSCPPVHPRDRCLCCAGKRHVLNGFKCSLSPIEVLCPMDRILVWGSRAIHIRLTQTVFMVTTVILLSFLSVLFQPIGFSLGTPLTDEVIIPRTQRAHATVPAQEEEMGVWL